MPFDKILLSGIFESALEICGGLCLLAISGAYGL
jgi:hypothetical protein